MVAEVVADRDAQPFTGPRLIELQTDSLPIPCPKPGFFSLAVVRRHLRSIPNLEVQGSITRRAATHALQKGWRPGRYPYADKESRWTGNYCRILLGLSRRRDLSQQITHFLGL